MDIILMKPYYRLLRYSGNNFIDAQVDTIRGQNFFLDKKMKLAYILPPPSQCFRHGPEYRVCYQLNDASPMGQLQEAEPEFYEKFLESGKRQEPGPEVINSEYHEVREGVAREQENPATSEPTRTGEIGQPSPAGTRFSLNKQHWINYLRSWKKKDRVDTWQKHEKRSEIPIEIAQYVPPVKIQRLGVRPATLYHVLTAQMVEDALRKPKDKWEWLEPIIYLVVIFAFIGFFMYLLLGGFR